MLLAMRTKFGRIFGTIIVSAIALVFIFEFGVNRGGSRVSATTAGSVNGDTITLTEFNRELSRRLEFFKAMGGGSLSEEQIQQFGIRDSVFREIVNRKLMQQEAERIGLIPSDAQVLQQIVEIPEFRKDGKFDRTHYKQVLEANRYTPGTFEKLIRDGLIQQNWKQYFSSLTRFSEEELKREFVLTNDKRKVKYVLLNLESGHKLVQVPEAEVAKVLADPAKSNLLKSRFEAGKQMRFKGKGYDQVKHDLAKELLQEEKTDEARKASERLADQVLSALTPSSASDAKVNALLKTVEVKVQTSSAMSRGGFYIPGAGELKELEKDAFLAPSPIDPAQGGKAKKYSLPVGALVAVVVEKEFPDVSKLNGKERESLINKTLDRKQNELFSDWIKRLTDRAKIEKTEVVLGKSIPDGT